MNDDQVISILSEIRNLIRASSYPSVKALLQEALPDAKARHAYQLFDGKNTAEQVRISCKMSPNAVVALAQRCTSMGLMEIREQDKKRVRLFDLADFGLVPEPAASEGKGAK